MTCDVVSTLAQANAAVALMDYAAALLDRSVPDGDGLALVQQWRQRGSHLPCLILTARDALHDRVDDLESGADDYLCKPFQMEELVARVRALLRRPVRQMPTETRFDDLLLIPEQGRLVCGSHSQTLPQTEMQLLEVLLRAGAAAFCSAVSLSFLIRRSKLPAIVARPFWTAASLMSTMTTSRPACAQTCAMPLPMVPAPMMPTVWMLMWVLRER